MYRTLTGLIAALALAVLLCALAFSASAVKPANVRFINGAEPDTLDPHLNTGQPGGRIITALFEGLTRQDARSLMPAPGVAQSWDISADGLTYTFHLRSDAVWSDGKRLGPEDFVYSWRRMLDPALGAEYAYILYPIKGARAFNSFAGLAESIDHEIVPELTRAWAGAPGEGLARPAFHELARRLNLKEVLQYSRDPAVRELLDERADGTAAIERESLRRFLAALPAEAERLRAEAHDVASRFGSSLGVYASDAHTLVVELAAPTPYFLDLTSFYSALPVPRHVIEKWGSAWFLPETIVSNGPFELESWRVNDRVRLRRSERYWGRAEVHADSIEVLPTENATTALNLYLTGEADWLPSYYPKELAPELRQRRDFYAHPAFMVYYYRLNTRRPPLNDVRVREALNLAIDRRSITERVLGLGELPADHFVPPGVPGYAAPPSPIHLDLARARELLAAAGFPGGKGFPKLGLLYTSSESHKAIAEIIVDQWKRQLGIDVVPYNQEWQAYLASSRSGNYDIARATWIGDYLDPNTFLDLWVSDGGNNQTGFSSMVYDELIRAAANMDRFAEGPSGLLAQLKEPAPIAALLQRRSALTDPADRRELLGRARLLLLREAEAILVQDQFPVLPVYFYVESGLYAHNVHGLFTELELPDGSHVPNLQDIHPLRDLWVDHREPRNWPAGSTAR